MPTLRWDVFLCHASEDKAEFVEPLVRALEALGLTVWYDAVAIKLGDDFRVKMDEGLRDARFGVVVLSPRFFKYWTQAELSALFNQEAHGEGSLPRILPVRCGLSPAELTKQSPLLASRVSIGWELGVEVVARQVAEATRAGEPAPLARTAADESEAGEVAADRSGASAPVEGAKPAGTPDRPLLHVCYAPDDWEWVQGYLLPSLGLAEGQCVTRADDRLGAHLTEEIERAVQASRYTVLVAGRAATVDVWARHAAQLAESLAVTEGEPRLIVIKRHPDELPLGRAHLVHLDCSREELWGTAVDRLRGRLGVEAPTGSTNDERACPYPGLPAFKPDEADLFFGRDTEGERIVERVLADPRRLFVIGPSGSGKSSLVRVRVLPALRATGRFAIRELEPGATPAASLREAVGVTDGETVAAAIDRILGAEVTTAGGGEPRLVIAIDPFEQVFTLATAPDRERFYAALGELTATGRCVVVACMRADFYGDLMTSPLWRDGEADKVAVAPLRGDALRDAIVQPAWKRGVYVEKVLVERLVGEVEAEQGPGALPLLQVALAALWKRRQRRLISVDSYQTMGQGEGENRRTGLECAIDAHASGALARLSDADAGAYAVAQRIFLRLIAFPEDRDPVRRRQPVSKLRGAGDEARFERVLAGLAEARLLTLGGAPIAIRSIGSDGDEGDAAAPRSERHADLAHESAIKGWRELARWITERKEGEQMRRRMEARADDWRARKRGYLDSLELGLFTRALATSAGRELGASDDLRTLIRRSRRSLRLWRIAAAALAAALLALTVALFVSRAGLVEEREKTRRAIAEASTVAEAIVFEADQPLAKIGGASAIRKRLLEQGSQLLDRLQRIGGLGAGERRTRAVVYAQRGILALEQGRLDEARGRFEQALAVSKALAAADPANALWQSDLSVSFWRLGDVAVKAGKLDEARGWFEQALAVSKTLAAADPANADWQRDLSVSYNKLGDVAVKAGELDEARGWFEQDLAVSKTLAAADPANADWQRDLSVSFGRLGDVAVTAGKLDEARGWFEQALPVSKTLAAADPANADWQSDLSVSFGRLGDVAVTAGKLDEARGWFEQALAVSKTLAAADPANADWQRDLSVSYSKLGDVAVTTGKLDEARGWFEQTLAVSKTLAAADPANAAWQRDLSLSLSRLGDVAVRAGELDEARGWFEQALAVSKTLAAADPANADWQRDLSVSFSRLGGVAVTAGRLDEARRWFEQDLAVSKTLAAADPANAAWQRDLSLSFSRLGDVAVRAGELDEARGWFEQALAVSKTLAAADPANADWQRDLLISHMLLTRAVSDARQQASHVATAAAIYRELRAAGAFQGDAKFAAIGEDLARRGAL